MLSNPLDFDTLNHLCVFHLYRLLQFMTIVEKLRQLHWCHIYAFIKYISRHIRISRFIRNKKKTNYVHLLTVNYLPARIDSTVSTVPSE